MQYLLDTHIILWWLNEPKKLSKRVTKIIESKNNDIYVSSASFWEISIKQSIGRIIIPANIKDIILSNAIKILAIEADEALLVASLPNIHKDPFDRIIIAQTKLHNFTLISIDQEISKYPIKVIN